MNDVCLYVLKHRLDEIRETLIVHVIGVETVGQIGDAVAAVLSIEGEDGAIDLKTSTQRQLRVQTSGEFARKR
jgi:hypothetical protein